MQTPPARIIFFASVLEQHPVRPRYLSIRIISKSSPFLQAEYKQQYKRHDTEADNSRPKARKKILSFLFIFCFLIHVNTS